MRQKQKSVPKTRSSDATWLLLILILIMVAVLYSANQENRSALTSSHIATAKITPIEVLHPEFSVTRISPETRRIRNNINLRRGPGTTYTKVGLALANTTIPIFGVSGDWYVTRHNGREVFIASWLTYDLPTATPVVRRTAIPRTRVRRFSTPQRKYTHSILNVRSGPDVSYRKIGQLGAGAKIQALGISGNWYLVKHNRRNGYVAGWLVHNSPPAPARQVHAREPVWQQPSYTCNCSKTCSKMSSCQEAYFQLNNCGCRIRDRDNDGVPCETICR